MKNKPKNIVIKFELFKLKEGYTDPKSIDGSVIVMKYKEQNTSIWTWNGIKTKSEVKEWLTGKQWSDYCQGKRNEFIIEKTRLDAKKSMIKNNKKQR